MGVVRTLKDISWPNVSSGKGAVFKGGKASCDGTGENDGVKFYRPPVIPRGPFSRQRKPDCQTPQSLLEWKLKQLTAAGVSPLAAAQGNAVVCSTEMPSEGHPPRPEVGWVELWDQRISSLKNQGSQTRIRYLAKVGLEETCMQMPGISEVKSIKWCKNSYSADIVNVSIPVSDCLIAEQQEVKILLETVQEQIRILTDARRSEDYELASVETEDSVSENTAFLPLSPTAKSEREAQFVLRDEIQRDPALTKRGQFRPSAPQRQCPRKKALVGSRFQRDELYPEGRCTSEQEALAIWLAKPNP
ncbi:hypothetical protein CB1_000142002 [Camelus ferus]|nr:hypothetical protein CB1_000142002 [Camelus ferus]